MNSNINNKRCMYNEEIKKKYIENAVLISESNNIDLFKRGIINRFCRSQELEKQMGKDIFELNKSEAKMFLEKFLGGGVAYRTTTIGTLSSYVEWAINNGYTPTKENPFSGLKYTDIDVTESYIDTMVKDEEDLIQSLDTVLCDIELDTADSFRWCVFLLIFAGISFKDIFYIKREDVNLSNRTIQLGSQSIQMSDKLFIVLKYYLSMETLQKSGKDDSEYERPIINEGYLLSNTKEYGSNREKMRLSCSSDISFVMKKCAKKLKPSSIHDSGIFYRMYLKEKETGEINCLEYLRARQTKSLVINFPERVKKICRNEYETWKKAFYL